MKGDKVLITEASRAETEKREWARIPFEFLDWCRERGSEYGIDTQKLILGGVLGSIVGDDSNCFGVSLGLEYMPKVSPLQQRDLEIRVELEIDTPELPENIRERLRGFLPILLKSDWRNEEDFLRVRESWVRDVWEFTKNEVDMNPEYDEAMWYEIDRPDELTEGYIEFVGEEREIR
jgi:hypothetical protein